MAAADINAALLEKRIERMRAVFDIDQIVNLRADENAIAEYYRANRLAYTLFHSAANFVHVGVSQGDRFKREDLLAQPKLVERYLRSMCAERALELAAGRGPNCAYLAKRNPHTAFVGLDRSEHQLAIARKASAKLENFHMVEGDFHDLSAFESERLDIVFIIEAFCYSEAKPGVLDEVRRILKPGGVFIIYDAYRRATDNAFTQDQQIAASLAEHGMAVSRFEIYDEFRQTARNAGFEIAEEDDLSMAAIPTCTRFERLARAYFKAPWLARAIANVFPAAFLYNAVTGYVLAEMLRQRVLTYGLTVLRKPAASG